MQEEALVRDIHDKVRAGKQPSWSELQTLSELVAVVLQKFKYLLRSSKIQKSTQNIWNLCSFSLYLQSETKSKGI